MVPQFYKKSKIWRTHSWWPINEATAFIRPVQHYHWQCVLSWEISLIWWIMVFWTGWLDSRQYTKGMILQLGKDIILKLMDGKQKVGH